MWKPGRCHTQYARQDAAKPTRRKTERCLSPGWLRRGIAYLRASSQAENRPEFTKGASVKIYFIRTIEKEPLLKIGMTSDVDRRISELQTGSGKRLELVGTLACRGLEHARQVEVRAHKAMRRSHQRGEWFRFGYKERMAVRRMLDGSADEVAESVWLARVEFNEQRRLAKQARKEVA